MNPLVKFVTIIIIAIEISFINSIPLNCAIMILGLLAIVTQCNHPGHFLIWFVTIPLIPALGSFLAQWFFGSPSLALELFTRIYAYASLGVILTLTIDLNALATVMAEDLHIPTKIIFGITSAIHSVSAIRNQIVTIKTIANLRGLHLTFSSPRLYFKAILAAIRWSKQLAEAMTAHGFVEDASRSHYQTVPLKISDWIKGLIIILVAQLFLS